MILTHTENYKSPYSFSRRVFKDTKESVLGCRASAALPQGAEILAPYIREEAGSLSSCSCPNLQSFQHLHFASPMPPLLLPGDLILTHLQTGENPVFRTIWLPSPVWRAVLITGAHIPTTRCVHFRTKSESILIFQTTLAALTDCLVFKSTQSMFYWSSAQQEC